MTPVFFCCWGFVHTVRQSLINRCFELAVVERLK